MPIQIHTETKSYQCRHIFTDGHRCGSKCLRSEEFCYYHHTTRRPIADVQGRTGRQARFDLPLPGQRSAMQAAIGEVIRRIARNEIDAKRAGLLLYGLQTASLNLPREAAPNRNGKTPPEVEMVEEIVVDPELGNLAPRAEVEEAHTYSRYPSIASFLLEEANRDAEAKESAAAQPQPEVLPNIQAVAHPLACRQNKAHVSGARRGRLRHGGCDWVRPYLRRSLLRSHGMEAPTAPARPRMAVGFSGELVQPD